MLFQRGYIARFVTGMRPGIRNRSIRDKLIIMTVAISMVAVAPGFIISSLVSIKNSCSQLSEMITQDAHMVVDFYLMRHSPAPIQAANAMLQKLIDQRFYSTIAILDSNQQTSQIASTFQKPSLYAFDDSHSPTFAGEDLYIFYPIEVNGSIHGWVYLEKATRLREMYVRLILSSLSALIIAVIMSLLLAQRFQQYITYPILRLAKTASRISARKDFSAVLPIDAQDEIGKLYGNFNQMLETIRLREKERDEADRAHRISEENFLNIFNNSYDSILLSDMNGKFLEVNETLCKVIGKSREELLKVGVLRFINPEYLQRRPKILEDLRTKGYSRHEVTLINHEGHEVTCDVSARLIIYEHQQSILSVMRDITERKLNDQLIQYEARVNKAIAQISKEIINPELSLAYISHTVDSLAQELTGSTTGYTAYYDPISGDKVVSTSDRAIDWNNSGQSIIRFPKSQKSDTRLWPVVTEEYYGFYDNQADESSRIGIKGVSQTKIDCYLSAPAISGNTPIGHIVVANRPGGYSDDELNIISRISDIYSVAVHQKLTNEELQREMRRAEESDRLKSAFLANMSHEIRTPMNGILGFTNLLRNDNLPKKSRDKYLNIITKSSNRLLHILNDIIDVSKIESGVIQLDQIQFSLNLLLDEIYHFFSPTAEKKNLKLTMKRRSGRDVILNTDRQKVSQILTNLVSNALKFTHEGGVELSYSISRELQEVRIQVKDTGIGIPSEFKDKIFQRFRQAETSITRQFGGTGLGLSISLAFAEAMGGKLHFTTKVNKGTTFTLTLNYDSKTKALKEDPEFDEQLDKDYFKGRNVLIVEDDETNYEYLNKLLGSLGIKLTWAKDGLDGVNKANSMKGRLHLILMDIKLPIMDGYTAARKIKEHQPNIPVIAQTAFAFEEDRKKAIDNRCDDFIAKPIDSRNLIEMLKKHLPETLG